MQRRCEKVEEKLREVKAYNMDLLKKISDIMSKQTEFERLQAKAEQNTQVITKRKDAPEKELTEVNKALTEKKAELEAHALTRNKEL